jgi:hypothetical protein
MSVDGTLRQVISKLLEGTDVNYEFSRAAEGGAMAITFLGHAPRGTAPVPTPPGVEKPDHPPLLHSSPYPENPPPRPMPPPEATPPRSQLLPDGLAQPGGDEAASVADAQSGPGTGATFLFTGSGDSTPARYLPFPDQNGRPIPVNNTPATVLPFPDQHGNPIPVRPTPGGSPFPPSMVQGNSSAAQ